ncbi:MAG: signal peptidase II [Desulfobacterota bacterium]|nr:signal peptidase II [Thermodesulfobacteriota bacterium]
MGRKYGVLLLCLLFILPMDQYTKQEVQRRIPLHRTIPVIEGFFNLTHVRNPGGAFGILAQRGEGIRSFFFVAFSLLAIGILLILLYRTKPQERILSLSFSLILSGAIGNLIDRVRYGEVIDFLDFYLSSFHWPAFNIADAAITIGIGLLTLRLLTQGRKGGG